jgi:hypothetical protein
MDLFCFASKNVENIRRGITAKRWAVATVSASAMRTRITKADRYFGPGSHGLLYCAETQSFTTPFVATSKADPEAVITDIWPEPWVLPFFLKPLGDLRKQVHKDLAEVSWSVLNHCGSGGVTAAMNATGVTVFTPVEIPEQDWQTIRDQLANLPH